jgi:RNA polymerase-interacting CarD/CdnL/TRCF family regulator
MTGAFQPGERVSLPLHGRGTIKAVERRQLPGGGEETFYVIALEGKRAGQILIPASRAKEHGLRRPLAPEEVDAVLSILAEPLTEEETASVPDQTVFYQRLKEKLKTGETDALARVVRRLYAFRLMNAITDIHLRELERHVWDALVDELAEAQSTSKVKALQAVRSILTHATPKEFLR